MRFISLLAFVTWIMISFKRKAGLFGYRQRMRELERGRFIRQYLEEEEELARYRWEDYLGKEVSTEKADQECLRHEDTEDSSEDDEY